MSASCGPMDDGWASSLDRLLDLYDERIKALIEDQRASFVPNVQIDRITVKRSYDVYLTTDKAGARHVGETNRAEIFVNDELVESYLQTLDTELRKNSEPAAYVKAKQRLIKERNGKLVTSLILKVREKKGSLSNWDRVASCVFAALKESEDVDYSAMEVAVQSIVEEISGSLSSSVDALPNLVDSAKSYPKTPTKSVEAIAADARLVKRMLETLPDHSAVKVNACQALSSSLVEMSSPLLRAAAVDLAVLSNDLEHTKHVTKRALEPDAHRLVEEAVRRMASAAGQDKTRERSVGYLLVGIIQTMPRTRLTRLYATSICAIID